MMAHATFKHNTMEAYKHSRHLQEREKRGFVTQWGNGQQRRRKKKSETLTVPCCAQRGSRLISSITDSIRCFHSVNHLIRRIRSRISRGKRSQYEASSSVALGLRAIAVRINVWTRVQLSNFSLLTISS